MTLGVERSHQPLLPALISLRSNRRKRAAMRLSGLPLLKSPVASLDRRSPYDRGSELVQNLDLLALDRRLEERSARQLPMSSEAGVCTTAP